MSPPAARIGPLVNPEGRGEARKKIDGGIAGPVRPAHRVRRRRIRCQTAPVVPVMLAKRPSPDTPIGAREPAMLLLAFGAAHPVPIRHASACASSVG